MAAPADRKDRVPLPVSWAHPRGLRAVCGTGSSSTRSSNPTSQISPPGCCLGFGASEAGGVSYWPYVFIILGRSQLAFEVDGVINYRRIPLP